MKKEYLEIYNNRRTEIDKYLQLMECIEKRQFNGNKVSKILDESNLDITYRELINMMKSNVSLMLYNVIEYTVSGLLDELYETIRSEELSYTNINDSLKTVWRKAFLKPSRDVKANMDTFLRQNEQMIEYIIANKTIELAARNTLPGGNIDADVVRKAFIDNGVVIKGEAFFRKDVLREIKQRRNELAHGTVSFTEALKDNSMSDLLEQKEIVYNFLDNIISEMDTYIVDRKYVMTASA